MTCCLNPLGRQMEQVALEPLFPDRSTGEPLSQQLVRRLRTAIQAGTIPPSSRLLSTREMARCLGLARNTVTSAVEQLVAEGYLHAHVGSGTFVSAHISASPQPSAATMRPPPAEALSVIDAAKCADVLIKQCGVFRIGALADEEFPVRVWQSLLRRHLASGGPYDLREAIAAHMRQFRGLLADANRVIITNGTKDSVNLVTQVLTAPGDAVVVEDPGCPVVGAAFSLRHLNVVPVPVDDEGIVTHDLPHAKLAYLTPSHQFPLGGSLSLPRHRAVLEWARENDAYIFENDSDCEFAFDPRPAPAMQPMDADGRVIYAGTFSRTLAPGLRLGYIVVPSHLTKAFECASQLSSIGQPDYVQAALAEFIESGSFGRHVRRINEVYRARRNALADALSRSVPGSFRVGESSMGLHVVLHAPSRFDDVAAAASLPPDLYAVPLSSLCVNRTECRGFVLGFGSATPEALRTAAAGFASYL